MKKTISAALAAAALLALATPAHAYGVRIDGNGLFAQIVAWFTGDEGDKGVLIDPNG